MQRMLFVLLLALLSFLAVPAQWSPLGTQSIPMQMTSDYHGLRITQHGSPLITPGPVWRARHTPDDWVTDLLQATGPGGTVGCCIVEDLAMRDDSSGFLVYLDQGLKRVVATRDRGLSWTELQPGTGLALRPSMEDDLQALDDTTAYLIGQDMGQATTLGMRLTPTTMDTVFSSSLLLERPYRIHFLNPQVGFVVAGDAQGNYRLYRTADGGATWSNRLSVAFGALQAMDWVGDSLGFVGGVGGVFYTSTDQGITWNSYSVNGFVNVNALDFLDADHGYAACDAGMVLRTTDGGLNWATEFLDSTSRFISVKAVTPDIAYVQGSDSVLYKRNYVAGSADAVAGPRVRIHPQPAAAWAHITLGEGDALLEWRLWSLSGQPLGSGRGPTVALSGLPAGTYVLSVASRRGIARKVLVKAGG